LRATVIYAYLLLTGKGITGPVTQLLHSIIKVSEILYSDDSHRSPEEFYNSEIRYGYTMSYATVLLPFHKLQAEYGSLGFICML